MDLMYKILTEDMVKELSDENNPNYDEMKYFLVKNLDELFNLIYEHYPVDQVKEKIESMMCVIL